MKPLSVHVLTLLCAVCFLAPGAVRAQTSDASGMWRTPAGALMHLYRCGGGYCGKVARISPGGARIDVQNKDPKLRKREIKGLQVLVVDKQVATGKFSGTAYNPENGKTYTGHLVLVDDQTIKVGGCVLGFLCQSQVWKRVK